MTAKKDNFELFHIFGQNTFLNNEETNFMLNNLSS